MAHKALIGSTFGRAVCAHFNLPANQVGADVKLNTASDEVFSVSLEIMLSAADMIAIGNLMAAEENGQAVANRVKTGEEGAFVETRQFSEDEICKHFSVPK